MEQITLSQVAGFISIVLPILGVLWFLFKIYQKIEVNDKMTRINLKATNVMLNHFIENKIGNGEFKAVRKEIESVLLGEKE